MPYIELSITISIVTFPTAESNVRIRRVSSLVISSFKLVQTSREVDVIFSLFFTTRSREMYASDFASRFFDKSCNQSQAEWMILCTYLGMVCCL